MMEQKGVYQKCCLYDTSAEEIVLGTILRDNNSFFDISEVIEPGFFYSALHQRLYREIDRMIAEGMTADPRTMAFFIKRDEAFKGKGEKGEGFLLSLVEESFTSIAPIDQIAQSVYEYYLLRNVEAICLETMQQIRSAKSQQKAAQYVDKIEGRLLQLILNKNDSSRALSPISRGVLQQVIKAKESDGAVTGLATGFAGMDELLGGLQKTDLTIIAARPSMGKTALALSMMINIVQSGKSPGNVVFISLEMSTEQLILRMVSLSLGISLEALKKGMISSTQLGEIERFLIRVVPNMPIIIDDAAEMSIDKLKTRLRRLRMKKNICCVFVDYLQLLTSEGNAANRTLEISEITRGLKGIAKSLDASVVALSQLSRNVESRENKRPQLSDLRDSGSIEQDADVVIFLYRESYYLARNKPSEDDSAAYAVWLERLEKASGRAELIVAKHRNGPVGHRALTFNQKTVQFRG